MDGADHHKEYEQSVKNASAEQKIQQNEMDSNTAVTMEMIALVEDGGWIRLRLLDT